MSPRVSLRLLSAQSDRRLLDLVARGHERAFEALVLRYRRPLLAYCARLGLADARAEDVVQQSLLKAWLALAGGVEVRELRPWLYRIVHNTAVNALRSQPTDGTDAQIEPGRAYAPALDDELERALAARQALSDVAALPPMQRSAILLSAVEGRSHEEVASALGVTSTAARGLIYRARAALRSAAAALTPPWVVQWASGGASRVGPSAARLAQLYASAGSDSSSGLLKGATLAVTAALAAGAAIAPLGPGHDSARAPADSAGTPRLTLGAGDAGPRTSVQAAGHGYLAAAIVHGAAAPRRSLAGGAGGTQHPTAHAYSRSPVSFRRTSQGPAGHSKASSPISTPSTPSPAATASSSGTPTAAPPAGSGEGTPTVTGAPPPAVEKPVTKEPPVEKPPEEPGDDGGEQPPEHGPLPPPPIKPEETVRKPDE